MQAAAYLPDDWPSPISPPTFPLAEGAVPNVPADLLYTAEHEYVRRTRDPAIVEVGITDYAQGELGDIVFVDLPKPGGTFARMAVFGTIEAVKAVSELYCPVGGEVVEINTALADDPGLINRDTYGAGWMVRLRLSDKGELEGLLDAKTYTTKIGG